MRKIAAAVLAILVVIVANGLFYGVKSKGISLRSVHYFAGESDFMNEAVVSSLDGGVIVAGKNHLFYFDSCGNKLWEKNLYSYNSICASKGETIAIAEPNSGELYILNKKGETEKSFEGLGRIIKLKVFDSGTVGAVTEDAKVYLYIRGRDRLYSIDIQNGDILDFDYSAKYKKLGVITLDKMLNTYANVYSLTGEIVGGRVIDDQLALGVQVNAGGLYIITDKGELNFSYGNKNPGTDAEPFVYDGLHCFDIGSGVKIVNEDNSPVLYNNKTRSFEIEDLPEQVCTLGRDYVLHTSEGVKILSRSGSVKNIFGEEHSDLIKRVVKIDDNSFVIWYSNKVEFYKRGR